MSDTRRPRETTNRKKVVVVLTAVALLGGAGAAYAYWTQDGTGSGAATTGSTTGVTVTQTGTASGLKPGLAPIALSGTITNPAGNGAVKVGTVTVSSIDVTPAGAGTCDATDYTISGTAPVDAEIADGGSTAWTGLAIAFNDKATNQDACKGATLVINYAVSAAA